MGLTAGLERHALVTGASGYIGSLLCEQLLEQGWHVTATTRSTPGAKTTARANDWVQTDLHNIARGEFDPPFSSALDKADTVFHLAGLAHQLSADTPDVQYDLINATATGELARRAARSCVRRFIYISSIKAMGESTPLEPFTPDSATAPLDAYGRSKLAGEGALRQACQSGNDDARMSFTIVRPPLVYGAGARANLARLIQTVNCGIPLPLSSVDNQRAMIGRRNLVDLLLTCANDDQAKNRILLPADIQISSPELIRLIAQAMNKPSRLFPVAPGVLRVLASLPGIGPRIHRLTDSLMISDPFLENHLAYRPATKPAEEIQQMVMTALT